MAAAQAGLGLLLGLAPSAVLWRRLERAAALLPALHGVVPDIDHPGWAALIDAVTVQETRLFRHPALLEAVTAEVLPALGGLPGPGVSPTPGALPTVGAPPAPGARGAPLRLVSAGCATGEEAFTLAMLAQGAGLPAAVLGLDISRPALAAAASASWPLDQPRGQPAALSSGSHSGPPLAPGGPARDVPARYHIWLEQAVGRLRPGGPLRDMVRFQRANLLDPPAGVLAGADLIMCRNVLIYLLPEARATLLTHLAAALRPGGALVLGPSDTVAAGGPLAPWRPGLTSVWRRL